MEGTELDHGVFQMVIAHSAFPRLRLTVPTDIFKQGINRYIQSLPYEGLGVHTERNTKFGLVSICDCDSARGSTG